MNPVEMIDKAAEIKANMSFTDDYIASTPLDVRKEEGLGIIISQWSDWDGPTILRVFKEALEDSNFHDEAELVSQMLEKY